MNSSEGCITAIGFSQLSYEDPIDKFKLFLGSQQPVFMIHEEFLQTFEVSISEARFIPTSLGTPENIKKRAVNYKEGITNLENLRSQLERVAMPNKGPVQITNGKRLTQMDVDDMMSFFTGRNSSPETVYKQFRLRGFDWLADDIKDIYLEHPLLTRSIDCILKFNKTLRRTIR